MSQRILLRLSSVLLLLFGSAGGSFAATSRHQADDESALRESTDAKYSAVD